MSYRRTRAMFVKELHHITRDARSLTMALAMPVMMLLLYGYALSLDVDHIRTLIYDQDGTEASRSLMRQFEGSRYFQVDGFVNDYRAIERGIDTNKTLVGVVIPRDFGKDLRAGRGATVQLLLDGSDSNTASIAMGYAESVVRAYSVDVRTDIQNRRSGHSPAPPVDARMRVWYNSSLESKNYVVPGLIAVILMIIAGQLTSLTIAREWDNGTMEQILSTPLRATEIVLGKMFAYFVVGLTDAAIALVMGQVVFTVPFRGSIVVLAISTCLFLFGALFWGIFISAAARNQVAAYQLGMLTTFLPGFLMSGFVFALDTMPKAIQVISVIVPARYFVTVVKDVFLKGLGLRVIWLELVFLAIYATIVFLLSVRKMNQKVA
ncbi:MAG TPA: ABC transporter permease [Bryobacteraceae bacterium]|jgi:ABC-2 type transport system permease protein|nr:ABC transporter permease [Bryobacteraceae bacterium]